MIYRLNILDEEMKRDLPQFASKQSVKLHERRDEIRKKVRRASIARENAETAKDRAYANDARGAGLALIDPNGYMLFVKRNEHGDHGGKWALPGGKVEHGETPESAAEREAIEEIGYVSNGEYPLSFTTHSPVKFETFVKPVDGQFEPRWLMEHSDYAWRKPNNPPEPLHPGVRNLLYQMQGYSETHDTHFNPSELRIAKGLPHGGRWTKGNVTGYLQKTQEAHKEQIERALKKEQSREEDWKVNNLDEEEVDPSTEDDVREAISFDFDNMHNYEVVGPPDSRYNCIAWAFGFNDRWWNPGPIKKEIIDEKMKEYGAQIISDRTNIDRVIHEAPKVGHVKIAGFWKGNWFEHMTRQLPDGRWTSKFGGNGKTVQEDLTEMEGGSYGDINRVYDLTTKEYSRFRKDHKRAYDSNDWLS